MKNQGFTVTALCGNGHCDTIEFTMQRKRIQVEGSDGNLREISRLVCPMCRMWGQVVRIEQNEVAA